MWSSDTAVTIPVAPASDDLPRRYRVALWARVASVILGVAFAALALGLIVLLIRVELPDPVTLALALAGVAALSGMGIWIAVSGVRTQVVLSREAIEVCKGLRTRRLERAAIAGRRRIKTRYGSLLQLCPSAQGAKGFTIPQSVKTDGVYRAWIDSLPDLDALEARASEEEITGNPEFGATADERRARLDAGKKLANTFTYLTYAIAAWVYLYPQPYAAAVSALALLPILAMVIVARSDGLYRIHKQRNDAHPTFIVPVFLPALVLAIRAVSDIHLLDWTLAGEWAAGLAVVLTGFLALSDRQIAGRPSYCALYGLLMCAYGYGGIVLANALLDHGSGQHYESAVLAKSITRGRHTSYHLRLAPWGPREQARSVDVPSSTYREFEVGDPVCIGLRSGAVGIAWFTISRCGNVQSLER